MDTKLKKSSKLAKWIIFLAVLLPAVLLISMYPRMEQLMLQKEEVYYSNASATPPPEAAVDVTETEMVTDGTVVADVGIRQDVVNYAVEASYYLYGRMLQEEKGTAVAFDVLDRHGWINDFYTMDKETYFEFVHALQTAETVPIRGFEEKAVFEGCMPIESMAKRGDMVIAFGPLKPVGLKDPRTGKEPFAVV